MWNKKIIVACVIALIITIIFVGYIVTGSQAFKTEEKIVEVFQDNMEEFISVSQELSQYQFHWSIRKENNDQSLRSDWQSIVFDNNIQLIIKEQDYFKELCTMCNIIESSKSIENIIKIMDFEIITSNSRVDSNCIYFISYTAINFESGIIFSPDGNPKNPYITKLILLDDEWFYYEAS